MALSKIIENSIADSAISSSKLKDFAAAVDLNGVELVLDADADTSITADTDDRIDFKIAGVEHFSFSNSSGDTIIKPMVDAKDIKFQQFDGRTLLDINDGGFIGIANGATGAGAIRIFEDTDNGSNYVGLTAGSIGTSLTFTLPTADGSSGQFLKTDGSGALSFDTVSSAADDLTIGDAAVTLQTSSGNITIDATANDTDIIFKGTDNNADITMLTLDGSDAGSATFNHDIILGNNSFVQFGDAGENIKGDGSDLFITSSNDVFIDADGNNVVLQNNGTEYGRLSDSAGSFLIKSTASDKDMIFRGNDGGSNVDALTLDMSAAGQASFNAAITANAGISIDNINIDGTEIDLSSGDLTIDVAGDIILDADGGDVFVKDAGTTFGSLTNTSGNLIIKSGTTTAATFSGANVTFAGTVGSGAITSTGIVTGTAFTAGNAVLAEAELELLDGLTAGTAIASKVVTTDANIDSTGHAKSNNLW